MRHLFFRIKLLLLFSLVALPISPSHLVAAADDDIVAPVYSLRNEQGRRIKSPFSFAPGTTHTLTLTISNPGDDAQMSLDIINEQTSDDGQLDLMPTSSRLLAGAIKAEQVYSIAAEDKKFTLGHNEKRTIPITITMPTSTIKGQQSYLVSLTASPSDDLSQAADQSVTLQMNIKNPNSKPDHAKLNFSEFSATDYGGRRGFTVQVSNPYGSTYRAKKMQGKLSGDATNDPIVIRSLHAIEVAPYSYFDFFIPYSSMSIGSYHLSLSTSKPNEQSQDLRTEVTQIPEGTSSSQANTQAKWEARLLLGLAVVGPFMIIFLLLGQYLFVTRKATTL